LIFIGYSYLAKAFSSERS